MEEKILLPAARRIRGGEPLPLATRLRLDHGALTALLVPSPTVAIVAALRAILKANNPIEEDPGGIYDQCEELAGAEADSILQQLQAAPEGEFCRTWIRVRHGCRPPGAARAGYDLEL